MNIQKLIYILLLLLCTSSLFAQTNKSKVDTSVEAYLSIANNSFANSPDTAIMYSKLLLDKLEYTDNDNLKAKTYAILGKSYAVINSIDLAMQYLTKALEIHQKNNNKLSEANILNDIANIYGLTASYHKSIEFNQKAIEIYKSISDSNNIGTSYYNIALAYNQLNKSDSTIAYLTKSERYFISINDSLGLAYLYLQKSKEYLKLQNVETSFTFLKKSHKIIKITNDKYLQALIYQTFAELYLYKKQYSSAEKYINKSVNLSKEIRNLNILVDNYGISSTIYEEQGKYKKALFFQKLMFNEHDKLNNENKNKIVESIKIKFEVDIKNKEIELLSKDKKINEINIQKSRGFNILFIVIIILIVIVLMVVINRYKIKNKSSKLLKEQNKKLNQANKTKDRMLSVISHDVRNPFAAFQSITQSLYKNSANLSKDELKYYATSINEFTNNLNILLDNLLLWVKSQNEKIKYNETGVEIVPIIEKSISLYSINYEAKNIKVSFNYNSLNPKVFCDINMLKSIIRNLLNNAIKYTNKGHINIELVEENDKIIFSIYDTGKGIAPNDVVKLNKNKPLKSKNLDTNGLGLEIVNEFLKYHKSKLVVKSELNKGSVFSFELKKYKI